MHSLLKAILFHAVSNLPFIQYTLSVFQSPLCVTLPHLTLPSLLCFTSIYSRHHLPHKPYYFSKCIPPHLHPIMFLPLHHLYLFSPLASFITCIQDFTVVLVTFLRSRMYLDIIYFVLTLLYMLSYTLHCFFFEARLTLVHIHYIYLFVSIQHFNFSYMYTMFNMLSMWLFFLLCHFLLTFYLHIYAPDTSTNALHLFTCKSFTWALFLYAHIHYYLYFAFLVFNIHASTFITNTFIKFDSPINVSFRFKT